MFRLVLGFAPLLLACQGARPAESSAPSRPQASEAGPSRGSTGELVGVVTQADVEHLFPRWQVARVAATPDPAVAKALANVPEGAELVVVLATWCGDSRRELSRFWRALELAGSPMPFAIRTIAVDRAKEAPQGLVADLGIEYVPTFIVRRNGIEVGRVVESAPAGIEEALRALLTGEVSGVITSRRE